MVEQHNTCTDMNKVCGPATDFALLKQEGTRTVISYALHAEAGKELATWRELYFPVKQYSAKPTPAQAKEAILADINSRVKESIITGFVWNDKPVWLSDENQLNFGQAVAPVTLKIGEQADGTPVYETFETAEAVKAFSEACTQWRQKCLAKGYAEKDAVDWDAYTAQLDPDFTPKKKTTKKTTK